MNMSEVDRLIEFRINEKLKQLIEISNHKNRIILEKLFVYIDKETKLENTEKLKEEIRELLRDEIGSRKD